MKQMIKRQSLALLLNFGSVFAFISSNLPLNSLKATHFCVAPTCLTATRDAKEQVDTEEDLFFEEEDEYYEPCNKSFVDFQEELEAFAFLSSVDRQAPSRAQQVFDEMYEAHIMEDRADLWPNTTIYNLLIDCHAWSKSPRGGQEAQLILDRMQNATVQEIARPNVDTYIKVMEAWASRKQVERAQQVYGQLQERFESFKSSDLRPNTGAYNKLIKAWMKSGKPEAPQKAEDLLYEMMNKYKNGDKAVKPNKKTWVQVLKAYGEQPSVESVEKMTELLQEMARWFRIMGDEDCQPDTRCYNILIKTTGQVPEIQQQTEEILYDMLESFENGVDAMRPNGATFVHVYNSFLSTNDPDGAADTVEKILKLQESLQKNEDGIEKPDVRAYNAVLAVIARAKKDPTKAQRAKRLVEHMKSLRDEGDKMAAPNLRTYNLVLNAAAYTEGEPKELLSAFRVAVDSINDLRENPLLEPDPVSYGLFLRSCAQLMPLSDKRETVVENIFRKCCVDGQLGQYVLHELSYAASPNLCRKLLGGDMDDGVNLPIEWTRNVKNKKQQLR
jgi:hypothetical protein